MNNNHTSFNLALTRCKMDAVPEIIDLSKVIEPHLDGGKLISYSSRYLTQPGDNYGSVMLSLNVIIGRPDGVTEELPLVAKLPPLNNEVFWALFKPEVTALRENSIYIDVSPSVRQLQLDAGIQEDDLIEVFAKTYGCRISLNANATTLDRNAILVLENLQTSGYKPGKRQVMLSFDQIRVVLKYTAKYHALPIALRHLQPEKFEKHIRPKFYRFDFTNNMDPEMEREFREQTHSEFGLALGDDLKAIERCIELDLNFKEYMSKPVENVDGIFNSLAHNDLWTNNVMISYDDSGAPVNVKIVDFQIAQYDSLAHDLIFLLFSSVDTNVLETHYHDLLKYYYEEFIDCLEKTKCDTKVYSFQKFMDEINRIAPFQIPHSMFMSRVLFAEDKSLPDNFGEMDLKTLSGCSPALLQKLRDIVRLSQKFGFFW